MKFTGERFIPSEYGKIRLEHFHRYAIVRNFIMGKDVLDLACGEGYGSNLMAKDARSVTGVDISGKIIKHATKKYKRSNLTFHQGNAIATGISDNSFDVVISFETIEHLSEQEQMIAEIQRLLRPEGILVISSPNRAVYNQEISEENHFHVKELDFQEFDALLKPHFSGIEYYGQQAIPGSVVRPLKGGGTSLQAWQENQNKIKNSTGESFTNPVYFIAVCSSDKRKLESIKPSVLFPDKYESVKLDQPQINILKQTVESLITDRDAQKKRFEILQNSYQDLAAERDKSVSVLNAVIAEKIAEHDKSVSVLKTVIAEKDKSISDYKATLEEKSKILEEKIKFTDDLGATIESLVVDRDAQKSGVEILQNSYQELAAERDKSVSILNAVITEKDELINNLGQTVESLITDRDAQKNRFEILQNSHHAEGERNLLEWNAAFAEREKLISEYEAALEEKSKLIDDLRAIIEPPEPMINEKESVITRLNNLLAKKESRIAELSEEVDRFYNSRSWRLTAPLRNLVKAASRNNVQRNVIKPFIKKIAGTEGVSGSGLLPTFRILLVSYYCPTRAHAGGLRILDMYSLIKKQNPGVQIDIFTHYRPEIDWSLDDVNKVFDNAYLSPSETLDLSAFESLNQASAAYDLIDIQFHLQVDQINSFRKIGKKIIFTPMESLAKSSFIDWENSNTVASGSLNEFKKILPPANVVEELNIIKSVDEVVCVSLPDAAFLRALSGSRKVKWIETGISELEFPEAFSENFKVIKSADRPCRILYVAYFGSETNVHALRWFLDYVHPIVKNAVSDYKLTVVGRGDLSSFTKEKDNSLEIIGEVPNLAPYIQKSRAGIAPSISGSGFRGKVNQYSLFGVPSVVTPIAAEGLVYKDGVNIFIAEKPKDFAERCRLLLTDFKLNDQMGESARNLCLKRYSWQARWKTIKKVYSLEDEQ